MNRRGALIVSVLLFASPALHAESASDPEYPPVVPLPTPLPTEDPVKQREMQVHFLIATEYFKDGNYQAAIDEWKQVLKIQPNHALAKEKIQKAKERLDAGRR